MSLTGYSDKSKIITDTNLKIRWDDIRNINYTLLSRIPQGDIISAIVTYKDGEDTPIDGVFNIVGNKIEFLSGNNISTNKIEVKYLI